MRDLSSIFFPPGTVQFLVAVMCMTLSHVGLTVTVYELLLMEWAEGAVTSLHMLVAGAVAVFLFFHPSFMVTRGKRWAHEFLKDLSLVYSGLFLVAFCAALIRYQQFWQLPVVGLALAVVAAAMYRSKGFGRFCKHFELLWGR